MSQPYSMRGRFVELCDCTTICPCWVGEPPTDGRCTGAFTWVIDDGEIDHVDVTGLAIVSVSFHTGHRNDGGQEVYLVIDELADDQQADLLVAAFTGELGGPLGELGSLMGTLRGRDRAPITIEWKGRHVSLTVGRSIAGDAEMLLGSDDEPTELRHGRLSTVLGPRAEVGKGASFHIDLGERGLGLDVRGRAAMRGAFEYVSDGG